jgi:predicted permease
VRDVRYALRSLARAPGFTFTAILILALSVGAATAVFSLLYALVLRPLPVPNASDLVQVSSINHLGSHGDLTWRQYRQLSAQQTVFRTIITSLPQGVLTVETERATQMVPILGVSGNYFSELGATPALGRLIEPSDINESAATGEAVAAISFAFWQRHFDGSPSAIGQTIKVDGTPLTIVGVVPKGFLGLSITIDHDITVPMTMMPVLLQSRPSMIDGTSSWVATTGRLKEGLTLGDASAQVQSIWPGVLADAAPLKFLTTQKEDYFKRRVLVESGSNGWERGLRLRYARPLRVLLGIAGLVLLIAAINLCSLVFARMENRRQELGVRLAIGASRLRVIRELSLEGAIVGLAGGAIGLLLAATGSHAIARFLLRDYAVPTSLDVSPDATIVSTAMLAGIVVAAGVSALSAWVIARGGAVVMPSGAGRTMARSSRFGRIMVGAEVALSIVLLAHASLLVRSVYGMTSVTSGLTSDTVLFAFTSPRVDAYRNLDPAPYYRNALERVRAIPGVAAAAFVTFKPEGGALPAEPIGRAGTAVSDDDATVEWPLVSPGFFDVMGVGIVRGRDFTFADTQQTRKVAIISERVERQLFGEGRGVGAQIRISRRPEWQDVEVVGIARDARVFDVRRANTAIVYTPAVQSGALAHWKSVVVRTPESNVTAIARAIDSLGVEYIRRSQTLEYARGRTILQERMMAGLGGFFGLLALLLVSVGLYGLLSYVLSSRRKEFGIRLALGANPRAVAMQVAAGASAITAIGIAAGLVMTYATTPLTHSVLINVSPHDPIAIGLASLILLVCGGLAAAGPAWRASRVHPIAELRQD